MTGPDTKFVKTARRHRIRLHWKERKGRPKPKSHGQKGRTYDRDGQQGNSDANPAGRDYGLVYEAKLLSRDGKVKSRALRTRGTNRRDPDIAEWLDFKFYGEGTHQATAKLVVCPKAGRWLGITSSSVVLMCY
jgi:hypothetical protein